MPNTTRSILPLLLALLLLGGCGKEEAPAGNSEFVRTVSAPAGGTDMLLPDFTKLVEQEGGAVVNIQASRTNENTTLASGENDIDQLPENDPFSEFFKRLQPSQSDLIEPGDDEYNFGSGFLISSDGYILTNTHVLSGMNSIKVVLNNRREYTARLVGSDTQTDIALLKIDAQGLPTVKIGDPKTLRVGEWVAAIGAPFGFDNSVTAGIVSAKGRSLPNENYTPFIQTDVAINPGNSGGPLFNLRGQVVGVNSQIYSQSGGFMGISFAIPIDVAMNVADQLRRNGKVERGRIGVVIQEVSYDLAKSFGLQAANGALISQVTPGGPADKAGLQPGDIVQSVNGENVKASSDLPVLVGMMPPGTQLTLGIWRNGKREEVQVTLGSSNTGNADTGNQSGSGTNADNGSGFTSEPTGLQLRSQGQGLLVLQVEGAAQQAGLRRGDIILMVNRTTVSDENSFNQALNHADRTVALLIQRGNSKLFLALELHR
ncbi:Probable periplasmic serine endoprotease DegP-like precursor [Eikenella corrodens]|uniref:Probable periplasmic serine endoprotease DegP-like n=2 Tax=Eikenella corrodens TaxID=539 RepID=C0DTJ0_EIKCO|nr:DegQ family serine endoprotease [Eikenella corrodens]EEG24612.1 peptidase Do [Eikenella corrodens ATCC 23834]OAM29714.1 protease Do [Eikenella corrodens]OWP24303.1 protease Do [Eikenella corrodens]SNW10559.1 Probable periplasmic serine endoprotease DegP-like precursor [Eikenella corrodens]